MFKGNSCHPSGPNLFSLLVVPGAPGMRVYPKTEFRVYSSEFKVSACGGGDGVSASAMAACYALVRELSLQ